RCGWLDLVSLKYSIMLNGVTQLILTKADVLSGFDTIKVCTAYKVNGELSTEVPFSLDDKVEPVYTEVKGWHQEIDGITDMERIPTELHDYIDFLEKELELPITVISLGPDRKQTIVRNPELVNH
ncbi:MAG: adenylosuccinate synthetase, partial [Bacteroidia bacterium]|nr:adenylosuccinate synthetase [Bacteroidia bacterium]